ncbi:phage head closure protein [uncultured Sphingomonas sp.]|uniref:phage head closure protein n=1 Tax=uncultured Sphingomonas sp. TaxID=158754 RepID=UPI0025E3D134|nr:phage head closure protein [uncultured Sphingomonas sp.]
MVGLAAGDLRDRVTIERPVADGAFDGAGSGAWTKVATVWASVVDALPSRGEKLAEGINVTARPARIRMRYREDLTAAMRLVMGDRVMQIVAGPAVIGNRDGIEVMAEDYTSAGNAA